MTVKIELSETQVREAVKEYAERMMPPGWFVFAGFQFAGFDITGESLSWIVNFEPVEKKPEVLPAAPAIPASGKPGEFSDGIPEPSPRETIEFLKSVSGGAYSHTGSVRDTDNGIMVTV